MHIIKIDLCWEGWCGGCIVQMIFVSTVCVLPVPHEGGGVPAFLSFISVALVLLSNYNCCKSCERLL